jgi:rRNA-processing protein FCF1
MTTKVSFVDTNLFLHFPTLDQIDWLDLLRCDYVVIIVTATVIRELNRHKDAPVSFKLRERAASSLKKLYTYSELNAPILVRNSVELQFNTREPLLNFASAGLSKEVPDDFLIATIVEFKGNSPEANVVLMTDDLGLKLKAATHGINVLRPPEELRLPDELDPNQKRVRELEEKVRLLQLQIPDMKLVFESQEDRFCFTLKPELVLSPKAVNWRISRLRKRFPKCRSRNGLVGLICKRERFRPLLTTFITRGWIDFSLSTRRTLHNYKTISISAAELLILEFGR